MTDIVRNLVLAAIAVAVVATGGFLVGIWGVAATIALANLGWGFWLSAWYVYLVTEA